MKQAVEIENVGGLANCKFFNDEPEVSIWQSNYHFPELIRFLAYGKTYPSMACPSEFTVALFKVKPKVQVCDTTKAE